MAATMFPMVVYGPGDEKVTIMSWGDMPEDFMTAGEKFHGRSRPKEAPAHSGSRPKSPARPSKRQTAQDFLDAHDVAYDPSLSLSGLEELVGKLKAYLAAQEQGDGNGGQ